MPIIGNISPSSVSIDQQPINVTGSVSATSTRGFYSPVRVNVKYGPQFISSASISYTCPAGRIAVLRMHASNSSTVTVNGIVLGNSISSYSLEMGPSETITYSYNNTAVTLSLIIYGYTLAC